MDTAVVREENVFKILKLHFIIPDILLWILKHDCPLKSGETYYSLVSKKLKSENDLAKKMCKKKSEMQEHYKSSMEKTLRKNNPDKFDTTLLYFLLRSICSRLYRWPTGKPPKIQNLIDYVKNLRNNYCHASKQQELLDEYGDKSCLLDTKDKFLELIELAKTTLKFCDNSFKDEISMKCDDIINKPLLLMGDETYILECLKVSVNEVKNLEIYQKPFDIIDIDMDPVKVNDIFITPNIEIKRNDKQGNLAKKREIEISEIITNFTEVQNERKCGRCLVIEGTAGVGKSTLLQYILSQWNTDNPSVNNINDYIFIFYVECKNRKIGSLEDYFRNVTPSLFRQPTFDYKLLLSNLKKQNLLILVDGLDEKNSTSTKLLSEIKSTLTTADLIITTRPEYTENIDIVVPKSTKVTRIELQGIEKKNWKKFITSYWYKIDRESDNRNLKDFLYLISNLSFQLKEILKVSLNLFHLTVVYKCSEIDISQLELPCELIECITKLKINRIVHELQSDFSLPLTKDELHENIESVLTIVRREAIYSLSRNDDIALEKYKELRDKCRELKIPNYSRILSNFLMRQNTSLLKDPVYTFHHKQYQIYESAKFLQTSLKGGTLISEQSITKKMQKDALKQCALMLLGLITVNDKEHSISTEQAKDIIQIFFEDTEDKFKKDVAAKKILYASRYNDELAKQISSEIQSTHWEVNISNDVKYYLSLIKYVMPVNLCIQRDKYIPDLNDKLLKLLERFVSQQKKEELVINDYYALETGTQNDLINTCKITKMNYNITQYRGSLTEKAIKMLSSTNLKELLLHITDKKEVLALSSWIDKHKFAKSLIIDFSTSLEIPDALKDRVCMAIINHKASDDNQTTEDHSACIVSRILSLYSPCSAEMTNHLDRAMKVRIHSNCLSQDGIKQIVKMLTDKLVFIFLEVSSPIIEDILENELLREVSYAPSDEHKQKCKSLCVNKCSVSKIPVEGWMI